jgi:hypothetical protein
MASWHSASDASPLRENIVGQHIRGGLLSAVVMAVVAGRVRSDERPASGVEAVRPAHERFAPAEVQEVPDFRRHVVPLLGRLGCNGRACHGSLQGKGGFRLSLFGYDHKADHEALLGSRGRRATVKSPADSLILHKPTHGDEHGGGERMKANSWQYHLIRRWIESGAKGVGQDDIQLSSLEIAPSEVVFSKDDARAKLRVRARWSDGSSEDVTPLCRYQTHDESVAKVDDDGVVTNTGRGDTHAVIFYDTAVAVVPVLRPVSEKGGSSYPAVPAPTTIDELIVARLRKLGIVPSEICSDSEFLRRVSLDMTGTLPKPQEVEAFLADGSSDKRAKKVDELLTRPTYVARWTTKLCDITGNSPRHFDGTGPMDEYARQWYEWTARRVRENVPYDQLVAGIVLGRSRQPAQSYPDFIEEQSAYYREQAPIDFTARDTMPYYWARHTVRLPEERALSVSYAFLGVRLDCAQCHKHPFDRWTQEDFKGFTAFFDRIGFGVAPDARKTYQDMIAKLGDKGNQNQRERARLLRAKRGEVVPWNEVFLAPAGTRVEKGKVIQAKDHVAPRLLGGAAVSLNPSDDPRQALMDWMRRKDNPYFARVFVNRVWTEYFGVGIINPPDDLNLANPPSNGPLLDYLTSGFIQHDFDMKWLHREIATSQAYQRAIQTNPTNRLDERNFSRGSARRLPAEILFDAIAQATAGSAELARATTDVQERAIGPQGGALVGRRGHGDYASKVFGRSPRDTNCDCSASNEPNLLQAIYLQNDKEVLDAIDRKGGWLAEVRARSLKATGGQAAIDSRVLVREAFLRTLSRPPSASDLERTAQHFAQVGDPVEAVRDLLWSLLNMREFITNH